LATLKIFAFRLNTAAVVAEHRGKRRFFRAHSLGPGAADILILSRWHGQRWVSITPIWLEVKTEKGKQTREQSSFQRMVESLGHRYIVAHDWAEVEQELNG
jgi:hypothetical protein